MGSIEHCPPQRACGGTTFDGQFGPIELFRARQAHCTRVSPLVSSPVITTKIRTPAITPVRVLVRPYTGTARETRADGGEAFRKEVLLPSYAN